MNNVELNDFEEICGDLGLWDFDDGNNVMINPNPNPVINMQNDIQVIKNENVYDSSMQMNSNKKMELVKRNGRYMKSSALQLEEIQKYFDVPITRAAKELNVGLTVLKKRCRELNIARWPHRKIKSLNSLINNVQVI